MYFKEQDIYSVAPQFLLFKASNKKADAPSSRVGEFLCTLISDNDYDYSINIKLNFLEQNMLDIFEKNIVEESIHPKAVTYLPFMSSCFKKDIAFLIDKPKYLLTELVEVLSLYSFLYLSQMALNIAEWNQGEPESKPMYFILDTEKASSERWEVHNYGPKSIFGSANIDGAAHKLFPILSMLENLHEKGSIRTPLWNIARSLNNLDDDSFECELLKKFTIAFVEQRQLSLSFQDSSSSILWLSNLFHAACDQFDKKKYLSSERPNVNSKYVKQMKEKIGNRFIQNRKRGGNIFVINQDRLILLTNLTIGTEKQLRFNELLEGFRERGVYFDKQSERRLIDFYERIGNVERKSDSGDAVYVRKTI